MALEWFASRYRDTRGERPSWRSWTRCLSTRPRRSSGTRASCRPSTSPARAASLCPSWTSSSSRSTIIFSGISTSFAWNPHVRDVNGASSFMTCSLLSFSHFCSPCRPAFGIANNASSRCDFFLPADYPSENPLDWNRISLSWVFFSRFGKE